MKIARIPIEMKNIFIQRKIFLMRRLWILSLLPLTLLGKPVSVDEMFTSQRQLKLLGSFTYINIHNANVGVVQVQQPNGSYISVPTSQKLNQDYLSFSLQARYGVANRLELFSTLNSFYQQSRLDNNGSFSTQQSGDFDSFSLGFIVDAKREGRFPALLLGGSADVVDRAYYSSTQASWQYGKGYSLFATSFYTIDPLVFLLQASARINLPQSLQSTRINQADIYALSPMVYFAVNPFVSLNAGVRYQYSTRSFINGEMSGVGGSSVGYVFGVAYEMKSRLIFFANAESYNTAQYSSDSLSMMISYRI